MTTGHKQTRQTQPPRQGNGGTAPPNPQPAKPPTEMALIDAPDDRGMTEMSASGLIASEEAEIKAAILIAVRFGRNEADAYGALMKACERPAFQERCLYSYPRGRKQDASGQWVDNLIEGPSVTMAREFARHWRHLRYGFRIVSEDDSRVHLRGFAWDMLSNEKVEQDATFRKLVQRKKGNETLWVKPDERDLRELINKHGAIAERNCLLKVLPRDMVDDAMQRAKQLRKDGIKNDLDGNRKAVVAAFASLHVSATQLESFLGHPLTEVTADELVKLRSIWATIRDGNAHWSDYTRAAAESTKPTGSQTPQATMDDLTRPAKSPSQAPAPAPATPPANAKTPGKAAQAGQPATPPTPPPKPVEPVSAAPIGTTSWVSSDGVDPADKVLPVDVWTARIEAAATSDERTRLLSDASADPELSADDYEMLSDLVRDMDDDTLPLF